jgi:hypothetical protein
MKKLLLLVLLAGSFTIAHAQTTKGTWMMGLHNFSPVPLAGDGLGYNFFPPTNGFGISFGSSKVKIDGEVQNDKINSTQFGLSVNSHYFIADQFALGLVGNYSSWSVNDEDYKTAASIFLVGPEVKYYFDAGTKAKLWLKTGASIGSISYKEDGDKDDPTSLSQFGGGAGISIFPVSAVSIDIGMSYNVLTMTDKSDFGEYKYINGGLAVDVGFGIFF